MLILSLRGLNRNGVVTNKTIYFVATALNIVMFLSLNLYGKTSSLTMLRTIRE